MTTVLTKKAFAALSPFARGYAVYMLGRRDDQPNVPDEQNPFPSGTRAHRRWAAGQDAAIRDVVDGEE